MRAILIEDIRRVCYMNIILHRDLIIDLMQKIFNSYKSNITDSSGSPNYPSEGPITSDKDRQIIETIVRTKSYILLKSDASDAVTHTVYTIGLWLLFGLPELIFVNCTDTTDDARLNTVIGSYVQRFSSNIESSVSRHNNKIHMTRSYDYGDFALDGLEFVRLPEADYLKYDTRYMIWFYSYYMEADAKRSIVVAEQDIKYIDKDDGIEFNLFPVYVTNMEGFDKADTANTTTTTATTATAEHIEQLMERYRSWAYDDFSTDSDCTDASDCSAESDESL